MKNILVASLILLFMLGVSIGQVKQKGISVKLPSTSNAMPVPAADKADALVVTIIQDGSVYFGVERVASDRLVEMAKAVIDKRSDKTVYVKADARSPYSVMATVLDALAGAHASGVTFLTDKKEPAQPGSIVPPKGFELEFVGR